MEGSRTLADPRCQLVSTWRGCPVTQGTWTRSTLTPSPTAPGVHGRGTYTGAMNLRRTAVAALVVALSGCAASPGAVVATDATSTAAPSETLVASPSPTPSTSPLPDVALPLDFPVDGSLTDGAATGVVAELHRLAGGLPVLKVDVTADVATLSALLPDDGVVTFQWRDGVIDRADSDVGYFDQATFDPADYPLDSVGRMFDIADLRGVRGELILQIVDYRDGQVLMTVTSRPESQTVFFRKDGTAVAVLGMTGVADIEAGLSEVIGDDVAAYAVGFGPDRGYWADLPDPEEGVVLNRSRVGAVPVFETRRTESPTVATFDPRLIQAAPLAQAIARTQTTPDDACDVVVDTSLGRSAPVARITCGDRTTYSDLDGRDMTALIG